jgi:hypothetical protein
MRRRRIALLVVAGILALACNSLLGIEQAEPIGTGGNAGGAIGGAAGSDASTGGAGSGGVAGSGGSAAGAGGVAGAAGSDAGWPCVDTTSDAHNCGWCGHDCGAVKCVNSECKAEEVAGLVGFQAAMEMDDNYIFVTGGYESSFFRIEKSSGTLDTLAMNDENYYVALYNGTAFVSEYNTNVAYSVVENGNPMAKTPLFTGTGEVMGLVVDASGLYWQDQGAKKIRRSNLDGTNPVDLVTNMINVWYARGDATDVYLASVNDGVYRISKTGSFPVDGASLPYFYNILGDGPPAIALDQDAVYVSTGDPTGNFPVTKSELLRVTKSNQQLSHVADAPTLILSIAISDGYAYWVEEGTLQNDFTDGFVRGIKIGDPNAEVHTYASAQSHPVEVRVDAQYVWWMNSGWTSISGGVMRVRK